MNTTAPLTTERERPAAQTALDRVRQNVARIQTLAHTAIDDLDPALTIAHARALRSTLFRAERDGVDVSKLKIEGDERCPR